MASPDFSGGVFSDLLEGGRAGATIDLTRTEVVATTTSGSVFRIPYSQCQIEVGGFSGRMVFCRNPDHTLTVFCEDRDFPAALARNSGGLLGEALERELGQRRRRRFLGRGVGLLILAGIFLVLVGGYFGLRAGVRAAVRTLPLRVDQEIGDRAFQSMDLGGPEIHDKEIVEPLQEIVDRLAAHVEAPGFEFRLHIIDSPEINAFALPGGPIVIYTGLLKEAKSAEEIAGVLGHEMGHVTLRHGLERISQALGLATAVNFLLGDTQGIIMAGAQVFQLASINSYSREQESEADAEAVRIMHEAKINPHALVTFFESLQQNDEQVPEAVEWLSTHPQFQERIRSVELLTHQLPEQGYEPLKIDLPALQKRIGSFQK